MFIFDWSDRTSDYHGRYKRRIVGEVENSVLILRQPTLLRDILFLRQHRGPGQ